MIVRYGDNFLVDGKVNGINATIYLKNIKDKRITILVRKGEKSIKTKNKFTAIDCRGFKHRTFCHIDNCSGSIFEFIPTNLKKTRVYIEPKNSKKLRNILNKKYRRKNN